MLNPLQAKLLEMLTWLSTYIEQHHLRYYVIGGTFLGAVRHQGFIPWDDDVDIAMPRPDYQKLLKLLSKPNGHYVVEYPNNTTEDFPYNFAKFYDVNTSMTETLRVKVVRGVYIDIFPLDGLGNTYQSAKRVYRKIDMLNMLLAVKTCIVRKDRKWWKNVFVRFGNFIPVRANYLAYKVNELCKQCSFDDNQFVASCMSTYRSREIMHRDIFGTPKDYKFENIIVKGPEKADEYLTQLFHNWRELPPIDKRHSAHDFIDLDLEHSYLAK